MQAKQVRLCTPTVLLNEINYHRIKFALSGFISFFFKLQMFALDIH